MELQERPGPIGRSSGAPATPRATRRVSIRFQLLVPMLMLVILTSIGATSATAILLALGVQREHQAEFDRVVTTLTESSFPLTHHVLEQLSGFSNTEFVLANPKGEVLDSTLKLSASERRQFRVATAEYDDAPSTDSGFESQGREYVVDRIDVMGRGRNGEAESLYILRPAVTLTRRLYGAILPAIAVGLLAMLIATAIATWLARRFVEPIQGIARHAAVIARGEFVPVDLPERGDELGDLAASIDSMARRLDTFARQLRHVERMETISRIGAAMAHQLRNYAAGGRIAIELHHRDCSLHDDESLAVALRQFQLMERYLRQYLAVGLKDDAPRQAAVDLSGTMKSTLALVEPMANHSGIEWSIDLPEAPMVLEGDPAAIEQLFMNLLINAIEAASSSSRLPRRIAVRMTRDEDLRGKLDVCDSGEGPADEIREKVFDPFVTDKVDGVGLGLFVAKEIAERHHGRLSYDREGQLTRFRFEFPLTTVSA